MTTAQERIKILDMIREGKIKAEEGARLLQALHGATERTNIKTREPRWVRVQVTDMRTGKAKVNVNMPMGLVNVGIKLGARFIPSEGEAQFAQAMEAIRSGQTGKVFEYTHIEDAEHIEVWVE
jgi:hypothetical protein